MSLPSPAEIAAALIAREELPAEKGDIGPEGKAGEFGPPGPQGAKGDPGRNGTNGTNGNVGPKGPQGNGGPRGPKGEKGDKGDEGERGPIGPMGPTGAVGSGKALFPRPGGGSSGGAPSGAAGGDLSGTYPNPSVVNDSHSHTGATVTGFLTNPLPSIVTADAAGTEIHTAGGATSGVLKLLSPVGDFGGEVDIEGGPSTLDGGGNVGVFGGQGEFGGGMVEILGGIGVDGDGGAVELFGGETQSTNGVGGEVAFQGGEATAAGGKGGGFSMRGGTATDGGTPAQIILPGASVDAPGSDGVAEITTDGSTGAAGEFLGSDGAGKTVWATPAGLSGSAQTYTESNVTTDRAFNANSTTLDEIADVLGTLIADLRTRGVVA